jgi:hypothetical protein
MHVLSNKITQLLRKSNYAVVSDTSQFYQQYCCIDWCCVICYSVIIVRNSVINTAFVMQIFLGNFAEFSDCESVQAPGGDLSYIGIFQYRLNYNVSL